MLLLMSSLMFMSAPLALAENVKNSSSFDVRDILKVDEGDIGNESINEDFINQALEDNTSPAALLILRVINILSLLIGTFAVITIIIGGFILIGAGGEESAIDRGKAIVNQSIFGLILAFMSYFIVTFLISFFY